MVETFSGRIMTKPYYDIKTDGDSEWIRMFDTSTDNEELLWHRDHKTRHIEVIFGRGWKFQRDNEIPFDINTSSKFEIESMVYHRLIKGSTPLIIKIKEQ